MVIIFALLQLLSACQVTDCKSKYTDFFEANWRNNSGVFWRDIPIDDDEGCHGVSKSTLRAEYPALFPAGWQVGYIIQPNYPGYKLCSRDIRANMVSVARIWNDQVKQLCCDWIDKEKAVVYEARYQFALDMMSRDCCSLDVKVAAIITSIACIIVSVWVICLTIRYYLTH